METCGGSLICLGFLCLLVGFVIFLAQAGRPAQAQAIAQRPSVRAAAPHQRRTAAPPAAPAATGHPMREQVFRAQPGQTAAFRHPKRGDLSAKVLGVIHYTELWQTASGPNAPWVPTGNTFAALWLGDYMLYEWQSRLYLFDEGQDLTDQDINTHFLPAARQFAQSNQTAQVTVAWPPLTWTLVDIGRFGVARAEGAGLRLNEGAQGRFIHASGEDNRVLVVEDYQSGAGGRDTVWKGWQITWDDVKEVR